MKKSEDCLRILSLFYKDFILLCSVKIMSSPGQKCGTCGHIMEVFNDHLKCARCHEKGVGEDLCVQKKGCPICKAFTAEQKLQLAIPTYRA